jgi:hypothetical protein
MWSLPAGVDTVQHPIAQPGTTCPIETEQKISFAKLYDRKTPITAADLLNDRVLPFFEEHDVKLLRVLTDREHPGYCGAQDTFYVGNLKVH